MNETKDGGPAFTVRAVDNHQALVDALKKAIRIYENVCSAGDWDPAHLKEYEEIRATLTEATK